MKKKELPLRGMMPLDAGGIFLLSAISKYMLQSLVVLIAGFFVFEQGVDINKNMAFSFSLLFMTQLVYVLTPLVYSKFTGINYLRELNLKRGISLVQVLILVLMTLTCILAFMPLSGLFTSLMQKAGYKYDMSIPNYYENVGVLILAIIFIAVIPAVGEEVMYRGFVARGFRKFGVLGAFLFSSLLFATAHGNLLQLIYQFFLGLVLVTVYFATRSIWASITVHMANNTIALCLSYTLYKTTGSDVVDLPIDNMVGKVFAMLGLSVLGVILLCLVMWLFLRVTRKRQDEYVNGREVPLETTKLFGKTKNNKGIVNRYIAFIKYLNYSFEDDELDRTFKIKEEIDLENAVSDKEKGYAKELLDSRLEKDRRWDRNMLFLAIAFNVFLLIVNIVNAFKG